MISEIKVGKVTFMACICPRKSRDQVLEHCIKCDGYYPKVTEFPNQLDKELL